MTALWSYVLGLALLNAVPPDTDPRSRVRLETERAVLYFESGELSAEEMQRFATLANQGIVDIEAYLGLGVGSRRPSAATITFYVSSRIPMSRAYRRTILLPLQRVRDDSAPYLHETTHILLPARSECLWLDEGFASYVQSYVSETLGGYDGSVFGRGGNREVDRQASRYLATQRGQAVLPYVGGYGEPPDIDSERRRVAAPFYVLSHSFLKFLVQEAGLEKIKALHEADDVPVALERATGRPLREWKVEWLARLGTAGGTLSSGRGAPP